MYKRGEMGKAQSKRKQDFINSVIPFGTAAGAGVGTVLGILINEFVYAISIGAAFGMLIGYFVFAYYSKHNPQHTN